MGRPRRRDAEVNLGLDLDPELEEDPFVEMRDNALTGEGRDSNEAGETAASSSKALSSLRISESEFSAVHSQIGCSRIEIS